MKILTLLLSLIMFLFPNTINDEIRSLKNLSPKQRIVVMNRIKKQLVLMNKKERIHTIHLLKKKMKSKPQPNPIVTLKKGRLRPNLIQKNILKNNIQGIMAHPNFGKGKIKGIIKHIHK